MSYQRLDRHREPLKPRQYERINSGQRITEKQPDLFGLKNYSPAIISSYPVGSRASAKVVGH